MADGVFQPDSPVLRESREGSEWTDDDVCTAVLFASGVAFGEVDR